jgi:hypothetical protein
VCEWPQGPSLVSSSLATLAAIRRASLLFVVSLFELVAPFRAHSKSIPQSSKLIV